MRIALVPYRRNWSYDFTAQALAQHLQADVRIFHDDTISDFNYGDFDLVVDFWWRGGFARRFGERCATQVSSHRWSREKYGSLSAKAMIDGHLRRSGALLVPSERLRAELSPCFDRAVAVCPKGFHPETFGDCSKRSGSLSVGWAGNKGAADKRLEVLLAACPDLRIASDLTYTQMPDFYNSIDVITCASDAEGDPRPLIEGMACGCFPVVVDVGIVPELVRHQENGLIVERSAEAFREAFAWCRANLDYVRAAGARNAREMLATRTWKQCAKRWESALEAVVSQAPEWKVNARTERVARVKAAIRKRRELRAMAAVDCSTDSHRR